MFKYFLLSYFNQILKRIIIIIITKNVFNYKKTIKTNTFTLEIVIYYNKKNKSFFHLL